MALSRSAHTWSWIDSPPAPRSLPTGIAGGSTLVRAERCSERGEWGDGEWCPAGQRTPHTIEDPALGYAPTHKRTSYTPPASDAGIYHNRRDDTLQVGGLLVVRGSALPVRVVENHADETSSSAAHVPLHGEFRSTVPSVLRAASDFTGWAVAKLDGVVVSVDASGVRL